MIRSVIRNLLALDDPPERTALAFAIGVFIAFSPLIGLQTIIAAVISIFWKCNKVAILAGSCVSNPWTMGPIIALSWATGRLFLGGSPVGLPEFTFSGLSTSDFWYGLALQWRQLMPFALGACILSPIFSIVSYPLMLYFLRSYHRRHRFITGREDEGHQSQRLS